MSDLTDLIERVEKATGQDRGLDAALFLALRIDPWVSNASDHAGYLIDGAGNLCPAPPYTASIDAAVALVERVLPDAELIALSRTRSGGWGAGVNGHVALNTSNGALALVLALLRALHQESSHAD